MIMEKPLSSYKKPAPLNGSGPNWEINTPSPLTSNSFGWIFAALFCLGDFLTFEVQLSASASPVAVQFPSLGSCSLTLDFSD